MEVPMISIENVSKQYRLGQIGGTTLREELQRRRARRLGLEDPTKKIGAASYRQGETFLALDGISFDVEKGERVGIIGHNGAGKSTLLKLLSRITAPTAGKICLNGRVASMLEVGTGFHPELTGRENIYMNGAILGMTKKEIDGKLEDIIEFSECGRFIDTPVKRYSSGMYVKLAFSVAAHLDSEIMIMDEVLAVGDMKFQEKCLGKMGQVSRDDGRTILYVSHNMNTIRNLCTRCIVLDHGKLIFDGDVGSAIDRYADLVHISDSYIETGDLPRRNGSCDPDVKMISLRIDTDSGRFGYGSQLSGELRIRSGKPLDQVRLELPVRSVTGTYVTRFFSDSSAALAKDGVTCLNFTADLTGIAPGKYTLTPVLRQTNSWGSAKTLDRLQDVYGFEILPPESGGPVQAWNTYYSGYFVPPEMKLSRTEE